MYGDPPAFGHIAADRVWRRRPTATSQLSKQRIHPNHQYPAFTADGSASRSSRVDARGFGLFELFVAFLLPAKHIVYLPQAELFFGNRHIEVICARKAQLLRQLLHAYSSFAETL